jgi:hypothetical protein
MNKIYAQTNGCFLTYTPYAVGIHSASGTGVYLVHMYASVYRVERYAMGVCFAYGVEGMSC